MTEAYTGKVLPFRAETEYYFHEGCHIVEVSNSAADTVSIARARVEVGVTTRWHAVRNTIERYVILTGSGQVEVGNADPATVTTGDVVIIPAGVRQRITNTGKTDLLFLAICSPRFQSANYQDLEPDSKNP